jgi:predicted Zn-dependent peptidase
VLAVAGGFDERAAVAVAERVMGELRFAPGAAWRRPRIEEPVTIARKRHEQPFSVARPQLALGFKDRDLPADPQEWLVRDLSSKLLLDVLFSASSRHHEALYAADLIDDTFDASYSGEHDFGFTILGGETDDPDLLAEKLHATLDTARREGIDAADFELARNRFLGRWVRAFNSAESLAGALVSGHFRGVRIDALPQIAMSLTPAHLSRRLEEHLREECSAASILVPDGAHGGDAADGDDDAG